MNCWHCQTELIWGGDHSIDEEDFPCSSDEFGMVTNLSCPNCSSVVYVYYPVENIGMPVDEGTIPRIKENEDD